MADPAPTFPYQARYFLQVAAHVLPQVGLHVGKRPRHWFVVDRRPLGDVSWATLCHVSWFINTPFQHLLGEGEGEGQNGRRVNPKSDKIDKSIQNQPKN